MCSRLAAGAHGKATQRSPKTEPCAMCAAQGTRRYGSEEAEPIDWIVSPANNAEPGHMTTPGLSEMFAYHAVTMANTIKTSLIVFSRKVGPPSPAAAAAPCTGACLTLLKQIKGPEGQHHRCCLALPVADFCRALPTADLHKRPCLVCRSRCMASTIPACPVASDAHEVHAQ